MASRDSLTSTDYAHPYRPLPARLWNGVGQLAGGAGLSRPLSAPAMLAAARRHTGLADFGDPSFQVALEVLVDSIEREARLHPMGRAIMRGRIQSMLENRLRIEACYREHGAAILALAVRRPIVIAGLQRTGTTLLHRLIAADPRCRALRSWEALHPAPLPGEGRLGSDKRQLKARLAERGLRALAPDFFAIHPVEADAPEEDVLLLDHAFTTQAPEATLHVPSYASWLEAQDTTPSYRLLARALRLLLWQRPGDFWVLKTPHHLEHLAALLAVFPDAVIVQTHRDPQATMGSFCSMVAHGRGVFSDAVDPREVGRHWLRKVRRMIDRSLAVRDAGAAGAVVDVSYYDLLADPLAQVRRIYERAGLPLSVEAEAAMGEVLARQTQHRFGRHVYRLRDFGLSPARIEETFADYRARFAIRRERPADEATGTLSGQRGLGFQSPLTATVTGVLDLWTSRGAIVPLPEAVRIDGQTAVVTGATSGLGRAVAEDLLRRGARLILPARSGIPEVGQELARRAGVAPSAVEMLPVDLSDLDSVAALCEKLARRGERIDLLVGNAGVMPARARRSRQGFELMFAVHYLANHLMTRRLLASGVIENAVFAGGGRRGSAIPRIVLVTSETHRAPAGLDFEHFGAFRDYGITDGVAHYGYSKLALTTFACELARRLTLPGGPSVGVHSLCPGPVDSRLAREAPALMKPILAPVMRAFFRSPAHAAEPVVYLGAAPELAGETGWYMHLMRRKQAAPAATDPDAGARLWQLGEALLGPWLPPSAAEASRVGVSPPSRL